MNQKVNRVTKLESQLIQILHSVFEKETLGHPTLFLQQSQLKTRKLLSPTALRLVKQALSFGCVEFLVQKSGWQNRRHLRNGNPVQGKLWERSSPDELGLSFTEHTVDFLLWLTRCEHLDSNDTVRWSPSAQWQVETGDLFFQALFVRRFYRMSFVQRLINHRLFSSNGLIALWIAHRSFQYPANEEPDFLPWVKTPGVEIVETLQTEFAEQILTQFSEVRKTNNPEIVLTFGRRIEQILPFIDLACEQRRSDLCQFVLEVAKALYREPAINYINWINRLNVRGMRLSERTDLYSAATAIPRLVARLGEVNQQHRQASFYDDSYGEAKFWNEIWNVLDGDMLLSRSRELIEQSASF